MLSKFPIQWRWFLTAIFLFFRPRSSLLYTEHTSTFSSIKSQLLKLELCQGGTGRRVRALPPLESYFYHMQGEWQLKGQMVGFLVVEKNNAAWPHTERGLLTPTVDWCRAGPVLVGNNQINHQIRETSQSNRQWAQGLWRCQWTDKNKNVTQTAVMLPPNSDILVVDCWTSIPNFFLNTGSLSVLAGNDLFWPFPRRYAWDGISDFYNNSKCSKLSS